MSDNMGSLNHKIDSLVFDCFQRSSDIILQGRRCSLEPEIISSSQPRDSPTYKDNSDYCCQVLRDWKVNLSSPLVLDVSLLNPESSEFHLMERWKVIYKRKDDTKDGRLSSVSRRIVTLMRTLYCFIRLLPGFQLLNMCPRIPFLTFRLYNPEQPSSRNFVGESSYYDFPRIQTFRGTLYLGVRYMAASTLQRILQIPQGLLSTPSDALPAHLRPGRPGPGSLRSTVPIPIPGMGMGIGSQQPPAHHCSSEKMHSRSGIPAAGGIASYALAADLGGGGVGGGGCSKDIGSLRQEQQQQDQAGYRRDATPTHSRSLDSRPQDLFQGPHQQTGEVPPQPSYPRSDVQESEQLNRSLATPPKHPQSHQHVSNSSSPAGSNPLQQQDQQSRHAQSPGSAAGSLVSESGTSPGGGTPFYLNGAVVYSSNTGMSTKDAAGGRVEGRTRSASTSTGLSIGEVEGDAATGSGGSGLSPPYLECSTQLMSTSPQVGSSGALGQSAGALTLYQVPVSRAREGLGGSTPRQGLGDAARQIQQNQLAYNLKSTQHTSFPCEGIALSLHVALPRSPFETASVSYGDTFGTPVSEIVLRSRPANQSQVLGKSPYGSIGDNAGAGESMVLGQERGGRFKGSVLEGRRTSFSFVEDMERDDDDEVDDDALEEEEEEDMPFAWADHSTVLTQLFEIDMRIGTGVEEGGFLATGGSRGSPSLAARPSLSQKGTRASDSYTIPPSLVSFPDAPWCESGSTAVTAAIFNQLNEYKDFRSAFQA